jgi:hypothetical protein
LNAGSALAEEEPAGRLKANALCLLKKLVTLKATVYYFTAGLVAELSFLHEEIKIAAIANSNKACFIICWGDNLI